MSSALRWLTVIIVLVGAPAGVIAQPDPPPGQPPPGPGLGAPTENMTPAQLSELFDAMLVMQAQNALSLNEQQYGQFLSRLRVLQQSRRKNQQERGRIINELQKMTNPRNPQAPEADVKVRLTDLQELEARMAAELRRAYNGIDEVLTPVQQARFRVLEENIERRKLELIARARMNNQQQRQQNAPRPPPRRPPGR
jgi:hypothetical protein